MKKSEIVIREFSLKGKKVITADELKALCGRYGFGFGKTKAVLLNNGYLLTVFRGVYYLKDYNEKKTGVIAYSAGELLALGLKARGIRNWYFGLNTALKMLNLTHEVFPVNYVLNDRFNRIKPASILGSRFLFRKVKRSLFSFGIGEKKTPNGIGLKCSDAEKTLLDMAYLYLLSGKSRESVALLISDYKGAIDKKKILGYAKNYPKTVRDTLKGALNGQG
ncbi:MAG: hypothetical protein MUP55_03150 [Candidatus Aenigmarchaeota archaeon]|nr:hypothetical protein [Candidatus Aenigmarchaeota archaeon]